MERSNVAYDLSIYETTAEKLEKQEKKEAVQAKTIKVNTGRANSFKRVCNALCVAVILSLIVGVIATNAGIASATNEIAKTQKAITELESEKTYLQFSLESRMSLNNLEEYAVGTLGLVKMDTTQVEYIEIEEENKLEVKNDELKEKLSEAVKPVLSYFAP